jgi:hypothetical protein
MWQVSSRHAAVVSELWFCAAGICLNPASQQLNWVYSFCGFKHRRQALVGEQHKYSAGGFIACTLQVQPFKVARGRQDALICL